MSSLSESQQAALSQLRDLTNGGDDDVAVSVLESVDWDVQRAAEMIFGTGPPPPSRNIPQFEVDDSEQGQEAPVAAPAPRWNLASILTFPFALLSTLLRFVVGVLRIPLPRPFAFNLAFFRPRRSAPRGDGTADRWVRELEEETGALCIGTVADDDAAGPSTSSSTLRHRGPERRVLPDFARGTYEDVLRTCQRDARIACIVLVSEEHDDVAEFKKATLTDPAFVHILHANNVVVWGGDVRDREAHSAALKLQATTYPFVAFLALQPRRTPSSSASASSNTSLTVLSRHQGRASTTAPSLTAHLTDQLLPRVTPFLLQIKEREREREREREERKEQDRRFADSARRDGERISALMEAERREARAKAEAEAAREREERRRAEQQREREKRRVEREGWRRWVHGLEGMDGEGEGEVRVAVRLPDGGRVVRRFAGGQSLTALYAFVDGRLAGGVAGASGQSLSPAGHPPSALERAMEEQIALAGGADQWWGFQLALAYPRQIIAWEEGRKVGEMEGLRGGAQLVVSLLHGGVERGGSGKEGGDDDEYESESD